LGFNYQRGIVPNFTAKRIDLNLALEHEDTILFGPLPGGTIRHFVPFCAEKLAKMNQERVKVNICLPPELQYSGLHVDVKPLPHHPKWERPRTFVFNNSTTSQMFVRSFPELLDEPAKNAMSKVLELMKEQNLAKAEKELDALAGALLDLPVETQMHILYDKACLYSMKSAKLPDKSLEQERLLDQAVTHLVQWFEQGLGGGFEAIGRTASAETYRMARDSDLSLVRSKRRAALKKGIPASYWPTGSGRGSSGCVPRGVLVEAPGGAIPVECLRVGMSIFSSSLESPPHRIQTKVVRTYRSREPICIRVNSTFLFTPSQPLYIGGNWVRAAELVPGSRIETADSHPCVVTAVERVENKSEVYTLTTDDPTHNFLVSGLVCGNLIYK